MADRRCGWIYLLKGKDICCKLSHSPRPCSYWTLCWSQRFGRREEEATSSSLLFTNPTMTTQGYSLTAATKQERGDNNVFVRHRLKKTPTYRRGLKIIANWIATTLSLADMIVSTPQTLSMYIILSPCQRQGCEETLPEAQRQ